MKTEILEKADFGKIRYSQCWEDADILLEALEIKKNDVCLSIASAGDNSFALLSKNPKKVIAIDISPDQIAVCNLKQAAFIGLTHKETLSLLGVQNEYDRIELYQKIRSLLSKKTQTYFDNNLHLIRKGIIHTGKFENFFKIFRTFILPLVHSKRTVNDLLYNEKNYTDRALFFKNKWNNLRWKLLFKLFFSKKIVGALGRDPSFFEYADIPFSQSIFNRCTHALTALDPSENSYIEYILTGKYTKNLPFYLREENYAAIKQNINKIEFLEVSLEEYLDEKKEFHIDKYNFSNIFEYMSRDRFLATIRKVMHTGQEAKMAYWNLVVNREYPKVFQMHKGSHIVKDNKKCRIMHDQDKAFFYSKFVVEEVKNESEF